MSARSKAELYPFHASNIHEDRFVARFARAVPLLLFLGNAVCVGCFLAWRRDLLFWLAALLNVSLWMWLMRLAVHSVLGMLFPSRASAWHWGSKRPTGLGKDVTHIVVLPNYKEEEALLAQTLRSLAETQDAQTLRVILAMEKREGGVGLEKAERLKERFGRSVAEIIIALHPDDLTQTHCDGSMTAEVAGKASNLKWAVATAHQRMCTDQSINPEDVVVTVADADCLLHPSYFAHVTQEFIALRKSGDHLRSMWQAPQLPFRNYFESPAPSRIWGYVSSLFEFGGVASLSSGGQHMLFSAYSVPLTMAVNAEMWDGDVITEDHHAYLKAFFFSLRESALATCNAAEGKAAEATAPKRHPLRLLPVLLPVKSTSVASSKGNLHGWCDRWQQAKRHAQGVAELSYAVLATLDLIASLPFSAWGIEMIMSLVKVFGRLLCIHILPTCQILAVAALAIHWYVLGLSRPECESIGTPPVNFLGSNSISMLRFWSSSHETISCLTVNRAYALLLTLPALAMASIALTNYLFLSKSFLGCPADETLKDKLWTMQRGGVKPLLGSKRLSMALLVTVDCLLLAGPIMALYGFIPQVMAYFRVCFAGNNYEYVTAAKTVAGAGAEPMLDDTHHVGYGTLRDSEGATTASSKPASSATC